MKTTLNAIITTLLIITISACSQNNERADVGTQHKTSRCNALLNGPQIEMPSDQIDKDGYIKIFDGKSFKGWRGYCESKIPETWSISDGMIKVKASSNEGNTNTTRSVLIYSHRFKDFELCVDWKVSKGGESGIFYLLDEINDAPDAAIAPKYQIIDNKNNPNAASAPQGWHLTSSLYNIKSALPSELRENNNWNNTIIRVKDGIVEHFLNGKKTLQYTLRGDEWHKLIDNSQYNNPDYRKVAELLKECGNKSHNGYIGLQDMGHEVCFCNIKIKEL